jgi:hypothetical protein
MPTVEGLIQSKEHSLPKIYTITMQEFATPFTGEMQRFSSSEKVTRAHFTSLLVYSFAVSRGDVQRQIAYLEWLKAIQNFGYVGTFRNALWAGGLRSFGSSETDYILERFNRVKHASMKERYASPQGGLDSEQVLNGVQKFIKRIAFYNRGPSIASLLVRNEEKGLGNYSEADALQLIERKIRR